MRASILHEFPVGSQVARVSYDPERLSVCVRPGAVVTFTDAVGFRVLDEGDLIEFWPACSAPSGSGVYEIYNGGWLEQERARRGFVSATTRPSLREFLITAPDDCVGVLALQPPHIEATAL